MSYLVCHFGKYKTGNITGLQKHNQRENKEYSNKDIDSLKTPLNYDLINNGYIRYYDKVKRVTEVYRTSKKAIRKDAVTYCECIISSDKKFFENLTDDLTRKFFEISLDYLKNKIGEKYLIGANVHLDETTPHMHLGFVPMNSDGSLSAKKLITRNFLREVQKELPNLLKTKGFDIERGIEGNKVRHIDPKEFKVIQFKELNKSREELKALEQNIENKKILLKNINTELDFKEDFINNINSIKKENAMFSKEKIKINKSDFEKMKNIILDLKNSEYEKNLISKELDMLKKENESLKVENKNKFKLFKENEIKLHERIRDLREINSKLDKDKKTEIKELKKEIQDMKIKNYLLGSKINNHEEFLKENDIEEKYQEFMDYKNKKDYEMFREKLNKKDKEYELEF